MSKYNKTATIHSLNWLPAQYTDTCTYCGIFGSSLLSFSQLQVKVYYQIYINYSYPLLLVWRGLTQNQAKEKKAKQNFISPSMTIFTLLYRTVLAFIAVVGSTPTRTGRWEHGNIANCDYLFSASRREKYREDQKDALLIWLGPPSEAIRVEGKHGSVPLPSAWGAFASVLYTQCPHSHTEQGFTDFGLFLSQWMDAHPTMKDRPLYLAGNIASNGDGSEGGEFVVHLAHSLVSTPSTFVPNLRGVFFHAADAQLLPSALFFASKSFESGNGMNFWTIDRARQSVVCNARLNAVEFFSYDIKLRYELKEKEMTSSTTESEMFEYKLASVSDWTSCRTDIDAFAQEYSEKDRDLAKEIADGTKGAQVQSKGIDPALPITVSELSSAFPTCQVTEDMLSSSSAQLSLVEKASTLLANNVSIFLYSDIPHASEIICSLYVGIFVADALQYSLSNNSPSSGKSTDAWMKVVPRYNAATTEFLPTAWGATVESEKSPGLVQQSDTLPIMSMGQDDAMRVEPEPQLMTLFLRSTDTLARVDPSLRSLPATERGKNRIVVSKIGAISIFARLLHALANSEIDLLELMVMDRIDERTAAEAVITPIPE